jgi:hypothetical protein
MKEEEEKEREIFPENNFFFCHLEEKEKELIFVLCLVFIFIHLVHLYHRRKIRQSYIEVNHHIQKKTKLFVMLKRKHQSKIC